MSRTLVLGSPYRTLQQDPAAGTIGPAAGPFAGAVVNLAGANVSAGQWTEARKQEPLASRVDSPWLLHGEVARPDYPVRTVLSASAIGFYSNVGPC